MGYHCLCLDIMETGLVLARLSTTHGVCQMDVHGMHSFKALEISILEWVRKIPIYPDGGVRELFLNNYFT